MAKVVGGGLPTHSNGPGLDSAPTISPMSTTCSEMSTPKRYSAGSRYSQYSDIFGDEDTENDTTNERASTSTPNGLLSPPHSDNRGRLSPIQHIMSYRTPSPVDSTVSRSSRRSKDAGMNFGRFYKQSYIKDDPSFKKGPSQNPQDPRKSHFHRPENFSYMHVRKDFCQPMKRGLINSLGGARTVLGKTNKELQPVMKNKECIALSRFPRGHFVEDAPAPIERDDWPAPPAPAAAYPELLRAHNESFKGKENQSPAETNGDSVDGEPTIKIDPKIEKEMAELRKVNSGVGRVFLRHLEKKSKETPHLDPRSASRTPAADREPMYKTRYQSPIFASPSRDNEFRTRLYSLDDQILTTKYRTHPLSASPVPKPGYGLRTSNAPVSKRVEGYVSEGYLTDEERPYRNYLAIIAPESYEHRSEHSADLDRSQKSTDFDRSQRSEDGRISRNSRTNDTSERSNIDRRSYYTSQSSFEDSMYDPETGLRRSRYRGSHMGGSHLGASYLSYKRSNPHLSSASDDPPLIYPYEQLRITNPTLPHGTDSNSLERHLSKDEFESIFHMSHEEFYRLAEWKRNDMKKRVQLY